MSWGCVGGLDAGTAGAYQRAAGGLWRRKLANAVAVGCRRGRHPSRYDLSRSEDDLQIFSGTIIRR